MGSLILFLIFIILLLIFLMRAQVIFQRYKNWAIATLVFLVVSFIGLRGMLRNDTFENTIFEIGFLVLIMVSGIVVAKRYWADPQLEKEVKSKAPYKKTKSPKSKKSQNGDVNIRLDYSSKQNKTNNFFISY